MTYEVNIDIEDTLDEIGEKNIKDYIIKNKIEITQEDRDNYKPAKWSPHTNIEVDIDEEDFLDDMWEDDIKEYVMEHNIVTALDYSLEDLYKGDEETMIKDILYEIKQKHHCWTKEDYKKYLNEWIDYNL